LFSGSVDDDVTFDSNLPLAVPGRYVASDAARASTSITAPTTNGATAGRCAFVNARLEDYAPPVPGGSGRAAAGHAPANGGGGDTPHPPPPPSSFDGFDVVWIQWTLQARRPSSSRLKRCPLHAGSVGDAVMRCVVDRRSVEKKKWTCARAWLCRKKEVCVSAA
jgi:hypothetical protein